MPDTLTPIQTALAEAFMGNTQSAKDLFPGSPQTFDARLIALLQGLGQLDETILPGAISGEDVAEFLRAFDATNQAQRLLEIARLRNNFISWGVQKSFSALAGEASLAVSQPDSFASVAAADLSMSIVSPCLAIISGKMAFADSVPLTISGTHTFLYGHIEPPTEFDSIFDFAFDRQVLENDYFAASFRCNFPLSGTTAISVPVSCGCRLSKAGGNRIFFNASLATKITTAGTPYEAPSGSFYYSAQIPLVPAP